ncbi:MAG TPA: hypothetical protein PKM57_00590 [Kiritimatiellia bacterium]|nr:hypothetical protein [Kiritimatiellia bacterium]HPS06390.1 hypothetical protein [Kiritimatiellia bacterium]
MNVRALPLFALACALVAGCAGVTPVSQTKGNAMYWTQEFEHVLPLLGHRNWILVVDKAYPYQSAPGITTIDTKAPLTAVLEKVVADMKASSHVKPIFYTDQELGFITEAMAPGVESHRKELARILAGTQTQTLLHDSVFAKLAEASKLFNVVILKTEGTIAYSSVFIELDCAYWNADKEASLREKMKP